MDTHLSPEAMDAFCAGTLPAKEVFACDAHLETCASCEEQLRSVRMSKRYSRPLSFSYTPYLLAPDEYPDDEHLDYEKMDAYLAQTGQELELIESHLESCPDCRFTLQIFQRGRIEIDEDLALIANGVSGRKRLIDALTWRLTFVQKPVYAALLFAICGAAALVIVASRTSSVPTQSAYLVQERV